MANDTLRDLLGLDDVELRSRRAFLDLTDDDLETLRGLRDWAGDQTGGFVAAFYDVLLGHPETRSFFPDERTVERLKQTQTRYFLELFDGILDGDYVTRRLKVGQTHERVGLPPKFYIGAYSHYLRLVTERLGAAHGLSDDARAALLSLMKLVHFDMALAIDTYNASYLERITRHQAAIRELSTPVIKVHDQVLLLPLIGTIDSMRAQQVMEAVLDRVMTHQARVLILDIAGVGVVDTEVASHLIKTTAAVRLLGAETVLTGITASVARTIVELGVDITSMHTRSTLSDGIELALGIVGKTITEA